MQDFLKEKFETAKILIIEPEKSSQVELTPLLEDAGLFNYIFMDNIKDALDNLTSIKPDFIIVGPKISVENKVRFCTIVRQNPEFKSVRILLQAESSDLQVVKGLIKFVAVDLILRPIMLFNMVAGMKLHLENKFLTQDLQAYREKTLADLDQARQMQDLILPKPENIRRIESNYGVKISSYFETCDITGGDFWGVEPVSKNHISFYIVDCTGHGITAALNAFRTHALIKDMENIELKLNPARYLNALNRKLCDLFSPGEFATMFYGLIDLESEELFYASSGATLPIHIDDDADNPRFLPTQGLPLGISKTAKYETCKTHFGKKDKLVLYSDSLIENYNSTDMYGEDRLLKSVKGAKKIYDSEILMARIINKFSEHKTSKLNDDLTINIYSRI